MSEGGKNQCIFMLEERRHNFLGLPFSILLIIFLFDSFWWLFAKMIVNEPTLL